MGEHATSTGWVLTATGLISAGGDTADSLFAALLDARPLAALPDLGLPAVGIPDFDPKNYVDRKGLKHLSRTSQLACAAAARLRESLAGVAPEAVGVVLGSSWAALDTIVRFEHEAHTEGPRFVDPILFTETVPNVPAGQISIFNGWSALNATIATGTGSGLAAMLRAVEFLRESRAEVVVAGGADALNRHLVATLHAEGYAARTRESMPHTRGASGPVCGEGACLFAIESAAHAQARGANTLGTIVGGVSRFAGNEAADRTRAVRSLLESAGWQPSDVDLLVLSGNGSAGRDAAEAATVREVFRGSPTAAIVPKAVLGETWAAAGPLGVALGLAACRAGRIPARPAAVRARGLGDEIDLPCESRAAELQRVLIVDCAESGQLTGLAVRGPGGVS